VTTIVGASSGSKHRAVAPSLRRSRDSDQSATNLRGGIDLTGSPAIPPATRGSLLGGRNTALGGWDRGSQLPTVHSAGMAPVARHSWIIGAVKSFG
jgi:hypothetical protein